MSGGGDRVVGVALDFSESCKNALIWALDNLADRKDRIILIHVHHPHNKKAESGQAQQWEKSGSPLIPLAEFTQPSVAKQYDLEWDAQILDLAETAARQKELTVVAKIYWGDAREKLCDAVDDLKLDSLVVGSRGLGPLKRIILGSVSNYVVQHATCPVTVVKEKLKK